MPGGNSCCPVTPALWQYAPPFRIILMASPSVILCRPQLGENIGSAARAMKNFGLTDLRLVTPRDGWPNEKAAAMAIPIIGAIGGGGINLLFIDHFQDMSRGHFVVRKLERKYGADLVRTTYGSP